MKEILEAILGILERLNTRISCLETVERWPDDEACRKDIEALEELIERTLPANGAVGSQVASPEAKD